MILLYPVSLISYYGRTLAKILLILMYCSRTSHNTRKERFTLYRTPPTRMLFFSILNLDLILLLSSRLTSFLDNSREILPRDVELESSILTKFNICPSGFKIEVRISEN